MRGALNRKDYCGRHWQDHLRGCGEHHRFCSGSACRMGSSPRMRGARQSAAVLVPTTRIIPADAGSTPSQIFIPTVFPGSSPRMRGAQENVFSQDRIAGSSPRMRGAHDPLVGFCVILGIIPVDAGSTSPWPGPHSRRWDHPRGCGEHMDYAGVIVEDRGSSPRMRGARTPATSGVWMARIIPADAGSTRFPSCPEAPPQDHPRGCGEHSALHMPFP